jgi:hypothetical protein
MIRRTAFRSMIPGRPDGGERCAVYNARDLTPDPPASPGYLSPDVTGNSEAMLRAGHGVRALHPQRRAARCSPLGKTLLSLVWFVLLCSPSVVCGCSSSGCSDNQGPHVQGTLFVTGNMPFTRLAFLGDDGTRYILKCPAEIEQALNRSQGKKFIIRFSEKEDGPDGPILTVIRADPLGE